MANFRPAGLSDEDSDSDDYGFYEKPVRKYQVSQVNIRKTIENTLRAAIINGNITEVDKIISCDLNNNVNMKLDSGWTPLMHACFHGQDKIVDLLLEKGADPNLHADSVTPIMAACSNSSANTDTIYNIVTKLVKKGSILNIGDKYGQTPLMRAIGSGFVSVVRKLLEEKVNIEMRDQQGWTALFWATHHNQPEIIEMLIANGVRLTEVDRSSRTALDIAISHDHTSVIDILSKHTKKDDDSDIVDHQSTDIDQLRSWFDFYPGIKKGDKPNYSSEIRHLLYGMGCERLTPLIEASGIDLKTFLLIQEDDMIKLGIEMPYERQRLKTGLHNFHTRGWKLNAVSGLYARKVEHFTVIDCLTSLGSHLQQIYVLEATLQYVLREYNKVQNQIKYEPPDSPLLIKMKTAAKKMLTNINSIRHEVKIMKNILIKINKNNPQPADLIKEKSLQEIAVGYITEVFFVCSLGLLAYHTKRFISTMLKQ